MSRTYNAKLMGFRLQHAPLTAKQIEKEIERKKDNERKMRDARQHRTFAIGTWRYCYRRQHGAIA